MHTHNQQQGQVNAKKNGESILLGSKKGGYIEKGKVSKCITMETTEVSIQDFWGHHRTEGQEVRTEDRRKEEEHRIDDKDQYETKPGCWYELPGSDL